MIQKFSKITLLFFIIVFISFPLYAISSDIYLKVNAVMSTVNMNSSSVIQPIDAENFMFEVESDLFFGKQETWGLRMGVRIVDAHLTSSQGSLANMPPSFLNAFSLGGTFKWKIPKENANVVCATEINADLQDNTRTKDQINKNFIISAICDVAVNWFPHPNVGLNCGMKLGIPFLAHSTLSCIYPQPLEYDEWIWTTGFIFSPYLGITLHF